MCVCVGGMNSMEWGHNAAVHHIVWKVMVVVRIQGLFDRHIRALRAEQGNRNKMEFLGIRPLMQSSRNYCANTSLPGRQAGMQTKGWLLRLPFPEPS